jgi:uncharacterized protein (TIGR03435 family)
MHYTPNGIEFQHTSMKFLAGVLALVGRPVMDESGIEGLFDFNLFYANRGFGAPVLDGPAGAPDKPGEGSPGNQDQPTIFEALQRLGLKLESRQGTLTTFIVDHAERIPAEN